MFPIKRYHECGEQRLTEIEISCSLEGFVAGCWYLVSLSSAYYYIEIDFCPFCGMKLNEKDVGYDVEAIRQGTWQPELPKWVAQVV